MGAAEKLVTFHQLLAEHYKNLGFYDLALEQYEEVLRIEPANSLVLNNAGIAAGQTAQSRPTLEEKNAYLERAERYYEVAIQNNPSFRDPYFGLAVLYVYEFEDLLSAKTILRNALDLFPDDTRMLFLLAQIAVREERIIDAIDIYSHIAEISPIQSEKNTAIDNRETLLGSY